MHFYLPVSITVACLDASTPAGTTSCSNIGEPSCTSFMLGCVTKAMRRTVPITLAVACVGACLPGRVSKRIAGMHRSRVHGLVVCLSTLQ